MLIQAITYEFKPADADEAARILAKLSAESRKEPGCAGFEVARSIESPHIFVLYETWKDQAALDFHYGTPHFQELGINGIRKLAQSRTVHLCNPVG